MNSRDKGKRGEREFAAWLREHGVEARRGQQFSGGEGSPDVVHELGLHCEVKRTERFRIWDAVDQAAHDSGGKPWFIAHRASRKPWVIVMGAEDWLELVRNAGEEEAGDGE